MKETRAIKIIEEAYSVYNALIETKKIYKEYIPLLERYFFLVKKAAYLGNAEGQYVLGLLYGDEPKMTILRPNEKKTTHQKRSFYWYKKACSNNYPYACHNLAGFYGTGTVVKKNEKEEFALLLKAFNLGLSEAGYAIAIGFKQEEKPMESMEWLKKVLDMTPDDGEAMLELAKFYFKGIGIKKSYKHAYEWFLKAADSNYITQDSREEAIFYIGKMYFYGYHVPQSIPIAKYLINLANIDQDHSDVSKFYQRNENVLKSVRAKKIDLSSEYLCKPH